MSAYYTVVAREPRQKRPLLLTSRAAQLVRARPGLYDDLPPVQSASSARVPRPVAGRQDHGTGRPDLESRPAVDREEAPAVPAEDRQ